jgi:hypothetical protein
MSRKIRTCGLLAATMLSAVACAQSVSFSVTENGVYNETTVLGSSTIIDGLTVASPDPPPLVLDSAALVAMQPSPASPISGDYFLYGALPTDFLEFQFTDGVSIQEGPQTWLTAQATLVASGGAMAKYASGSGELAGTFMPTSVVGNETTGSSSMLFAGALEPSPAPEPMSLAALGVGLIGLFTRRRRMR